MKKIKNADTIAHTWCGQEIQPNEYYELQPFEEHRWANDSVVLSAITAGTAIVNDGNSDLIDIVTAINFLKDKLLVLAEPKDSDDVPLFRLKMAASGSKFRLHGIKFKTSDLDSLSEKKCNGNSYGWATLKLYDANNNEITDAANEINAVMSVVEFEPTKKYEIYGGRVYQKCTPSESIIACAVFAPTIPEQYGGQVHFLSECDLSFLPAFYALRMDGQVPKTINYDPVYHSGQFNFVFHHSAGFQHELLLMIEIFEP